MAAAFQSPKLDTYFSRQKDLDRRVMLRYELHDPFQAISDGFGFRSLATASETRMTTRNCSSSPAWRSNLVATAKMPSRNNSAMACFGQIMGSATGVMYWFSDSWQSPPASCGSFGNGRKSCGGRILFLSRGPDDQATQKALAALRGESRGSDLSHGSAFLVRLSGLLLLVSGGLVLICAVGVVIRGKFLS